MNKKYTLITGASSGIGYELAINYANLGENLILIARRIEILEDIRNRYKNIDILILNMDLSDINNTKEIYNIIKEKNIFVNRVINNAGVGLFGDFIETDIDKEISMINLNITSLMILTKMFLNDMKNNKEGEIINVSSIASFMPGPKMAVYYATKAFVTSFSKAIYYEVKNLGINVSILAPGATSTNFEKASNLEKSSLFDNMRVDSAKNVADYTVRKTPKTLIIPGILNKITVFFVKFIPSNILLKIVDKLQKRKDI